MEEPLEIPIINDLTMVLGSISQVNILKLLTSQLHSSWCKEVIKYAVLWNFAGKRDRSCYWFHWSYHSLWQCETGWLLFRQLLLKHLEICIISFIDWKLLMIALFVSDSDRQQHLAWRVLSMCLGLNQTQLLHFLHYVRRPAWWAQGETLLQLSFSSLFLPMMNASHYSKDPAFCFPKLLHLNRLH